MKSIKRILQTNFLVAGSLGLVLVSSVAYAEVSSHVMSEFTSAPISLTETSVSPQVLINASNDHQLYFKAYNDYSDLDNDGIAETTYKHSIDYYGYFDSYKCYNYDAGDNRFEPAAVTADKYCKAADGNGAYWSGNFLNWGSMTRIDAIRKILFGGHRRVDTSTDTVLERAFIPPDIHAFAKYYAGSDVDDLVPFTVNTSEPTGSSVTSVAIGTGSKSLTTQATNWIEVGDYLTIAQNVNNYMQGWVTAFNPATGALTVDVKEILGAGTFSSWAIANHTRVGLTLCNVTYSATADFSQDITDPPLIRAAAGNYSFWSAGEGAQCVWDEEAAAGHGENYNDPSHSSMYAAQDHPVKADVGLGNFDYVARVQVCEDANGDGTLDMISGQEKCKQYPFGNYKPFGLLQTYGDSDKLLFGMIAGTYGKARHGGEMVQKIYNSDGSDGLCREINLGRDCNGDGVITGDNDDLNMDKFDDWVDANHNIGDGTFRYVHHSAGGTISQDNKSQGIINTWSLFRIYGYKYGDWDYNSIASGGDNCPLSVNFFDDEQDSKCSNWGNPFSEIYLSSLRYFGGLNSPTSFQSGDGQYITGINYNTGNWLEPITAENYCARLNIVNFNSSVVSADTVFDLKGEPQDELDSAAVGVVPDLGSPHNSTDLTEIIGRVEKIYPDADNPNRKWFVGETIADMSRTCTAKEVTNLGNVRGLCPEGPDLRGGFRMAGIAWYAHTNDIRSSALTGGREVEGIQSVDTYAVRLAAGNPVIDIPVPGSATEKVTILPSCITNNKNNYGCTMVDFKIVEPHTEVAGVGHGKFLVIWEDSLQGNDYDLDAGGIIEYTITSTQITINTAITLQNLGYSIGHGYVISGTTEDGLHLHSGTNAFIYDDPLVGIADCNTCSMGDGVSSQTYTLGAATAGLLEDPLWYAAKWGGFDDQNDNDIPDLTEEWDSKINASGDAGSDGIPDNYYYATNPQDLEEALDRVFLSILERTSSGTAAAVVSNNVRGEGALYQAYYEPLKKDNDGNEAQWIGTVHALWLDSMGYTRQDCSESDDLNANGNIDSDEDCHPNGKMDDYGIDQVVQTFFDETEERTRVKVYSSQDSDKASFQAYSMEGVVNTYTAGAVELVPYSMEGAVKSYSALAMVMEPYSMTGTVAAYDPDTGDVTLTITAGTLVGPNGEIFDSWNIDNTTALLSGKSTDTLALVDSGTLNFVITPADTWITVGDEMVLSTYDLHGIQGHSFNNWYVQCLDDAVESVVLHSVNLASSGEVQFTVEDDVFGSCGRLKISTFNMMGVAGNSYNEWNVTNKTTGIEGASTTSLTLVDSGTLSYNVLPAIDWIVPGDRLLVSNYAFVEKELHDLGYLWNAREQLYLPSVTDADLKQQRPYESHADTGRFITTWIDSNQNSTVDANEYTSFVDTMFPAASFGFFDVATQADAEQVVNYIRGVEITGTRSRTVKYSANDSGVNVMRLGDVINSTPTIVQAPLEAFNVLYSDTSYTPFRQQYENRRVMAYVGGNDGLLHAFNGGFYGTVQEGGMTKVQYSISGKDGATGLAAPEHPLGSEMWAYAPMNLLPHLKWLQDANYDHVYYVDSKPRIFDAKIFPDDANHPNGWGTVMVVGMRMGGGPMTIDTHADGHGLLNPPNKIDANDVTMRSSYLIFDITNPEVNPLTDPTYKHLLAEIQMPDDSFSMVYPAAMAYGDINKWYLVFGSGPNVLDDYTSTNSAKLFLLDLEELFTSGATIGAPAGCSVDKIGKIDGLSSTLSNMNVITCDTGVANTFMGSPVNLDWDLDYQADAAYFGLVGDANATSGQVMRLGMGGSGDPTTWIGPTTLVNTNQPVVSQPQVGLDNFKNLWVYFGTGRYFTMADKTSVATQTLYGVKDINGAEINVGTSLINATDIEVYADDDLTVENGPISTTTSVPIVTFDELVEEVDDHKLGWYLDLPPIVGTAGVAPATRSLSQSVLLGGINFSSVFQPSDNPCAGEGNSRLYGLYYKTGTAYANPAIFGTDTIADGSGVKYQARKYVDLGSGLATSPSIHSGADGDTVSVITQMSTADVFRVSAETAEKVRSGKSSWILK